MLLYVIHGIIAEPFCIDQGVHKTLCNRLDKRNRCRNPASRFG